MATANTFGLMKLDNNNFLLWHPQILEAIKGHCLQDYIDPDFVPPLKFLSETDQILKRVNPLFSDREQQDQLLYTLLLSSITEGILARVVSCPTAAQVWSVLQTYFTTQTAAKIDQFRMQLQNLKKGSLSLNAYLLKVRLLIDQLNFVGYATTSKDHISAIFNGLPSNYDNFIIAVNSRQASYTVAEIEAVMLSQESRLEKHARYLDSSSLSVNYAQANAAMRRGNSPYSSLPPIYNQSPGTPVV